MPIHRIVEVRMNKDGSMKKKHGIVRKSVANA